MMALAVIGILVMAGIIGYGFYMISENLTLKNTKPRYKYIDTTDKDGNISTKIVEDDE
jgi:hypothetical protein